MIAIVTMAYGREIILYTSYQDIMKAKLINKGDAIMKKITCIFLITICCSVVTIKKSTAEDGNLKNQEIKMEFFNVPPHVFLDKTTGEPTGAVYQFINDHIAPEMGVKFIWNKESSNIPRQLNTLETKPGYAAALIVYTPDRSKVSAFTKTPYFMIQSALLLHKENPLEEISKIEDILHMKIGFASKTFITPFMRDKRVQFDLISAPNFTEINTKKLLSNRIDASYTPDKTSLLYVMHNLDSSTKLKLLELPEPSAPAHIVFSKGSEEMVAKYNQAFDKLGGQTLYLKILSRYIGGY